MPQAPYICDLVHIAYRTVDEKKERWAQVNEWMQTNTWPELLPDWVLEQKRNHGGGGGP